MPRTRDNKPMQQLRSMEIEWIKPAECLAGYINFSQVVTSLWEFTIRAGTVLSVDANANKIKAEEKLDLIMSPEHAKALHDALSQSIRGYEAQFGKIRYPPQNPTKGPEAGTLPPR